jgi:hypothetical protein
MIIQLAFKIKDHFATLQDLRVGAILILLIKTYVVQEIKELLVKNIKIKMAGSSLSMGTL